MKTLTYTPSINIKRDFDTEINYILTPNAKRIYSQIVSNYQKGSRSFNIVGAYGTGKSAFIVALEQSFYGKRNDFEKAAIFNHIDQFEFINIIGENRSIISVFAEKFNVSDKSYSTSKIIAEIDNYYQNLDNKALVIVIDELGKFLEFASGNNPEKELYFIQQFAEYVNDKTKDILLITILHKNFNAYSLDLTKTQIDEWNKVKGRLVEIPFNEPVEQLLLLASEKIEQYGLNNDSNSYVSIVHEAISESQLFPLQDFNTYSFSKKIYPFELLSASILTLALQEYAQNERSLFSFIENEDELGIKNFDKLSNPFYNLACVYDYLNFYHFSFISTKYNPHLSQWNSIKYAIERVETQFEANANDAIKLIKTIGLLNIFSRKGGKIDEVFIDFYGKYALGINDPLKLITELKKHKVIHYTKYDNRYKILQGTDLDFELAINEAGNLIERIKDVVLHLNKYFDFPTIIAKRISYEKGTPRLFNFILSEDPVCRVPLNEIDGFINLIFNKNITEETVREKSRKCTEAVLYGYYSHTDKIEETLFEIEKINKVIDKNSDDKVAVQELKIILNHYKALLNYYVRESFYDDSKSIKWYFNGEERIIKNQREFNALLSAICETRYPLTPFYRNELVNKTRLSGTISYARRNLFSKLINENDKPDFGFEDKKFPPEKTIFLSLIKNSGIYQFQNGKSSLHEPVEPSLKVLWLECEKFLNQTVSTKKTVHEFSSFLKSKPFKLKQGFIDLWLPLFLIARKNDFALFRREKITGNLTYIPELNEEVLDLLNKTPEEYLIRKFNFTTKRLKLFNKYREVLNQIEQGAFSNESFIETFKPFLVFYKNLPFYSKNTKRISNNAIKLREAIKNSIDPEEVFFNDFPKALGFSVGDLPNNKKQIEDFAIAIKESINEINSAYDVLINEIEGFINEEILGERLSFPANKELLKKRYKKLKQDLLKPQQTVFYNRIDTVLDDRYSWLNSISQVCIGKTIDNITDDEISLLKHKILENIRELDNYTELSKEDIDLNKEEIIKLEITSFLKGLSKKHIRIPKSKMEKINNFEKSFKKQLKDNDKTFNIALLTKLLQDELNDEES